MSKIHLKYDSASALTNNQIIKYNTSDSGATASIIYDDGTKVGIGSTSPTSRVTIKGSGDTSASYGLNVLTNSDIQTFSIRDDGAVTAKLGYWLDNGGIPEKTISRSGYYSYAFGASSLSNTSGIGNLAFGYGVMNGLSGTLTGNGNIGIGGGNMSYLTTGSGNIAIGNGTFNGMYLSGDNNIGIGNNAINNNGGVNSSIALGANSKLFGSNQFVIGSASDPINDIYLGRGVYDITGGLTQGPITIHATGVQGGAYVDVSTAAMPLIIAGSQGTGTGTGGDIIFKTAPAGASGASQNSLVEVARIKENRTIDINGGNGYGSILSIRQPSFTLNKIVDVYNSDYSRGLLTISSNATNEGVVSIAGGGINVNANNARVELGYYSGVFSRVLNIRGQAATEETIAVGSLNGTGGHYVGFTSNNPYWYMQDTTYATTINLNSSGNTFFNGGNVGIGTSSPSYKLHVAANSNDGIVVVGSGYGSVSLSHLSGSGKVTMYSVPQGGNGIVLDANGNSGFVNNLGVGQMSPSYKLQVSTNTTNDGILLQGNSYGSVLLTHLSGSGKMTMYSVAQGGNSVQIQANGNSYIYNDNFGLGTTNPTRKIDVAGTFNFEPVASTTYFRYDSFMFEMVKNSNNLLRINNDNDGTTQLFGSKKVVLYNPTSAGQYSIELTSTSIVDNTQISFRRSDSYHFGLWDTVNYRLAIGGLGTVPQTSAITSTLDITGSTGYNQLRLRNSYTPTSSGDTNGNVGDIAWDNNYVYVKTNTGWGRSALSYAF